MPICEKLVVKVPGMARVWLLVAVVALAAVEGPAAGTPSPPSGADAGPLYVNPSEHNVVLVGHQSALTVEYSPGAASGPLWLGVQALDGRVVRVLTETLPLPAVNVTGPHHTSTVIRLLGVRAGHTTLKLTVWGQDQSLVTSLTSTYRISVVKHVSLVEDYLLHATGGAKVLALLLLSLRVRPGAIKDLLRRPLVLLAAAITQSVLLPLVSISK